MTTRGTIFALSGVLLTAALAVAAPLWTYALTLALFGLPHVAAELRYVDTRFGARIDRGLAHALWAGLLAIVLLRVATLAGLGAPSQRAALELSLGAALVLCVAPRLLRRGLVYAALGAALIALALWAASVRPLDAIVWFAVLHNLTPVAFLAERLRGETRRRALHWCLFAFGVMPALIASGAAGHVLAALGASTAASVPPGIGGPEQHLGAFVPSALRDGALALDLFRAAAFLQCLHYAVVLHVLPRLGAGDAAPAAPFCWPRGRWVPDLVTAGYLGLAVAFGLAFVDARLVYGTFAAVHAWIEVPVLALALASLPLGAAAAVGARA